MGTFPWNDGNILYSNQLNNALGYASNVHIDKIGVSGTTGSTVFTNSLKFLVVKNNGANTAYFNLGSEAAITDYAIESEESVSLNGGSGGIPALYHITSGTNTTDFRIFGTY